MNLSKKIKKQKKKKKKKTLKGQIVSNSGKRPKKKNSFGSNQCSKVNEKMRSSLALMPRYWGITVNNNRETETIVSILNYHTFDYFCSRSNLNYTSFSFSKFISFFPVTFWNHKRSQLSLKRIWAEKVCPVIPHQMWKTTKKTALYYTVLFFKFVINEKKRAPSQPFSWSSITLNLSNLSLFLSSMFVGVHLFFF